MKYILLLLTCMFAGALPAQKIVETVGDEVCRSLQSEKIPKNLSVEEATNMLIKHITPSIVKHLDEIQAEMGYASFGSEEGRVFGEKVGLYMFGTCDKYKDISLKMVQSDTEGVKELINEGYGSRSSSTGREASVKTGTVKGRFWKMEGAEFNFVFVKMEDETIAKFVWLDHFTGETLLQGNTKELADAAIEMTYEEREMYSARLQRYETYKVITGFSLVK